MYRRPLNCSISDDEGIMCEDALDYIKSNAYNKAIFENELSSIGEELDYLIDTYDGAIYNPAEISTKSVGNGTIIFETTITANNGKKVAHSSVPFHVLPGEWIYDEDEDTHNMCLYSGTIADLLYDSITAQLQKSGSAQNGKTQTKSVTPYLRYTIAIKDGYHTDYWGDYCDVYVRDHARDVTQECKCTLDGTYLPWNYADLSKKLFDTLIDTYKELYGRSMKANQSYAVWTDGKDGPILEMNERPYTDKYLRLEYNFGNSMLN